MTRQNWDAVGQASKREAAQKFPSNTNDVELGRGHLDEGSLDECGFISDTHCEAYRGKEQEDAERSSLREDAPGVSEDGASEDVPGAQEDGRADGSRG